MKEFNRLILALLISLTIWAYAKLNEDYQFVHRIRVEYEISDKNLTLLEGTDSVTALVSGKGFALLKFKFENPSLFYFLDGSKLEGTLEIGPSNLKPSQNVSLNPMQPKVITYSLDRITKKILPVSPTIRGNPKLGYIYLGWSVSENVTVEGPRRILENLDSIPTYPIDITGKTRDFEVLAEVFTEGLNLKVNPKKVRVFIMIDSLITRTVPVFLGDTSINVKIQGPSRILSPIVSLRGSRFGDSIFVEVPENVIILESPMNLKQKGY